MQKVQKTDTAEFKREAVQLVQTSGKPIAHRARELGISDTSIHPWRKELAENGSEAFPGSGHHTAQEEEVRRLKGELDVVKQERDILKKADRASSRVPSHAHINSWLSLRRSIRLPPCAGCGAGLCEWILCLA
jgi:transposase